MITNYITFSSSSHQQVHINSPFILNGICVRWKGYLDLERLDGLGCIEFDEETAKVEDVILREQVEAYNRRMKEFEEYRKAQQRHIAAFMGQHHALQQAAAVAAAQQHQISTTTMSSSALSTTELAEATSTVSSSKMPRLHDDENSQKINGQIHTDLVDIEEVSEGMWS
jgi:hypothetical protein